VTGGPGQTVQSKSVRHAHHQSSHPEASAAGKSDFFDSIGPKATCDGSAVHVRFGGISGTGHLG
jgi:hypothetical protein